MLRCKSWVLRALPLFFAAHAFIPIASHAEIEVAYPKDFTLIQRDTATMGEITIAGMATSGITTLEASYAGAPFVEFASGVNGLFEGTLAAPVGAGDLIVRDADDPLDEFFVGTVGVGDLFVVAGQSNALGRGFTLNSVTTFSQIASMYRTDDQWGELADPAHVGAQGSVWPILADYIIDSQAVPVGFITTAVGGSLIDTWRQGGANHLNMMQQVSEATYGSMKVKAMLFLQGASDMRQDQGAMGEYSSYRLDLESAAEQFLLATQHAEVVVVGQSNIFKHPTSNRQTVDAIRTAQQDCWEEVAGIVAGPVTYDVGLADGAHFRTDSQIGAVAARWWAAIRSSVYGNGAERGPRLQSVELVESPEGRTNILRFTFAASTNRLQVKDYRGVEGAFAGIRVEDGQVTLTASNIVRLALSGTELSIKFDTTLTANALVSYGSYDDGLAVPVLRDTSSFELPVETFSSRAIDRTVPYAAGSSVPWASHWHDAQTGETPRD